MIMNKVGKRGGRIWFHPWSLLGFLAEETLLNQFPPSPAIVRQIGVVNPPSPPMRMLAAPLFDILTIYWLLNIKYWCMQGEEEGHNNVEGGGDGGRGRRLKGEGENSYQRKIYNHNTRSLSMKIKVSSHFRVYWQGLQENCIFHNNMRPLLLSFVINAKRCVQSTAIGRTQHQNNQ